MSAQPRASARIYLIDGPAAPFRPLAYTRPLCELLFGAETFRERIERVAGASVAGVFSSGRFEGLPFSRLSRSPLRVNPDDEIREPFLLLDSVYVPAGPGDPIFRSRPDGGRFWLDGRIVGAWITAAEAGEALDALGTREEWRQATRAGEDLEASGQRPAALHEIVAGNAERIVADLERGSDGPRPPASGGRSATDGGVDVDGPRERLHVAAGAEVAGRVYVDVREGPVRLEDGVRVEPFSVLRGPLVARAEARLLGSELGPGVTIGPHCRIRGEVRGTIFLGYANKAHEGFIGDSYIGEWVNLGAGTTTSNLKNNYGNVRLRLAGEIVETGLLKLGSLIGDHVKTGIGTLLPTGTWIGPGTNLYGTRGPAPPFLPPFSWGSGSLQETHRLEAFLEAARRVMERRDAPLDPEEEGMLGAVFRATEEDRIAV